MITKWNDSLFVVTFTGEAPQSTLCKGWPATLEHIASDDGLGCDDFEGILNDPDHWTTLSETYRDNDDERHVFGPEEVAESVYLSITRITESVSQQEEVGQ